MCLYNMLKNKIYIQQKEKRKMKKTYVIPEIEALEFQLVDVLETSEWKDENVDGEGWI